MKNKLITLAVITVFILWIWIIAKSLPGKSDSQNTEKQNNIQQNSSNSGSKRKKNIRKEAKFEDIVNTLNPDECDKLEWAEVLSCKDLIYQNLSSQKQNIDYCYKISDKNLSALCISNISDNLMKTITSPEKCKIQIKDPQMQAKCIIQTQVTSWIWIKSLDDCSSITDISLKSKCSDSYYITRVKTLKTPNINDCKNISFEWARKECELIATKMTSINTAKSQIETLKSSWDTAWAIKKECETSTIGESIQTCMRDAYIIEWKKTWNTSVCNNITDPTTRNECINWIQVWWYKTIFSEALTKKDITLCAKIGDPIYKAQCEKIVWWNK